MRDVRTITVSIKPRENRGEPVTRVDIADALIQFARLQEASDLPEIGTVDLPGEWLAYWHISEWPKASE